MDSISGPHYNEKTNTVFYDADGEQVEIHTSVSREEFELIQQADRIPHHVSALFTQLQNLVQNRGVSSLQEGYTDQLNELVRHVLEQYQHCVEVEDRLEEHAAEVLEGYLHLVYKSEKNLKHFLRCASVAHGIGFSQQLFQQYCESRDTNLLYDFVRNTCSAAEYAGIMLEGRVGKGNLDIEDKGITLEEVYLTLRAQNLGESPNPNVEIAIQPFGESMRLEDVPLDADMIEYLWEKRNQIVHRAPLVVADDVFNDLPEEIKSTVLFSESDADRICFLAHRLHLHTTTMFFRLCEHYEQNAMSSFAEAVDHD